MQRDASPQQVVETPLNDLNVKKQAIAPVLERAADDPYAAPAGRGCGAIASQVRDLDAVLGADYDTAGASKRRLKVGKLAQSVVQSIIPFRFAIREVTGASAQDRNYQAALTAGLVRRAYLKGLGQARGCRYPARPA